MSKIPAERVYLNASLIFDDSKRNNFNILATPAQFTQTFHEDVLPSKASDYSLSVVRMTIPTNFIPIKIIPCIPNPDDPFDVNMSSYFIVFRYNDIDYKRHLHWDPLNFAPTPNLPDLQNPRNYRYYSMYSFQHFCDMINKCFNDLMTDVYDLIVPAPPSGFIYPPPYMTFDSTTFLFSLVVHELFTENNGYGTTINIIFDSSLFANFGYFNTKYYVFDNSYATQIFTFIRNPTLRYDLVDDRVSGYIYKYTQEADGTGTLCDLRTINISSNTLKINHELQTSSSDNYGGVYEPILSDFGTFSSYRDIINFISYVPTAEYRRIKLRGDDRIKHLQLNVNWVDKRGYQYPILIEKSSVLTIKFLFEGI